MADQAGPWILIVDDEDANRALLRAILGRAPNDAIRSARILEAGDLATAQSIVATTSIDLVLLDVRLPDGNGLDLARQLVETHGDARPRIIVLSASVLPGQREGAIEAGADLFIGKPFPPSQVLAAIEPLLRR